MKKKDFLNKLREKTADEIEVEINDLRAKIDQKKIDQGFGRLDNVRGVSKLRKQLAQSETVLKEIKYKDNK